MQKTIRRLLHNDLEKFDRISPKRITLDQFLEVVKLYNAVNQYQSVLVLGPDEVWCEARGEDMHVCYTGR
jgi:hypothetical protein